MFQHPARLRPLGTLVGIVSLTSLTGIAHAGGFALIEQGASGMGNAYAGAAAVSTDSSTVWFNPAGISQLQTREVAIGLHYLQNDSTWTDEGTTLGAALGRTPASGPDTEDLSNSTVIPNLYYASPINDQWGYGLSIGVPFGSSNEYDSDWKGRYTTLKSEFNIIDINPAISYRINDKVSLGFGVSFQQLTADLGNGVDSGAACLARARLDTTSFTAADCVNAGLLPGVQANDGEVNLSGDSTSFSFNMGALFTPTKDLKIGVAYRHSNDHELDGDADFNMPESLTTLFASNTDGAGQPSPETFASDSNISAEVNLPPTFSLSTAWQAHDKVEVLGDITWTGWSSFQELRIEFENPAQPDSRLVQEWEDVFRYSAGINYSHNERLTLRTGVAFDEEAIPSTQRRSARIPGNDRTWLSFGAGYQFNKRVSLDLGYAHLFLDDTPIDNSDPESLGAGEELRGTYSDSSVNIFSAQLNWTFK